MKKYSVLLKYPDSAQENSDGLATYYKHVIGVTTLGAVAQAQKAAALANDGAFDADEFEPLLVVEGHHDNIL